MTPARTPARTPPRTAPRTPGGELPDRNDGGATSWDLLVIGGGTAGIVAAKTAAGFGARVLLVERDRTGGDCLWTGCVPSKALLAAAAAAAQARGAARFGVHAVDVRVDFGEVMAHVQAAIAAIEPDDSVAALTAAGVHVQRGCARFTGPNSVQIEGRPVRFGQAVIATGSAPLLPPIPGLAQADPLTSETVWALQSMPGRLLVVGGGTVGCELGQGFARLGAQVTLVEAAPRLLAGEDPDAAELVTAALRRDGVAVHLGVQVVAVHPGEGELDDGRRLGYDQLLVAVGRRPRSRDLNLQAAGVAVDERGYVRVDARLRTTNRRVWAAGDITGHPQFTHTAGVHGSVAASNAILGVRRRADLVQPRVTFTQPEVAAIGVSTDASHHHGDLHVRTMPHEHVDRAVTDGDTEGFTRLVLDRKSRIVGATIVGPRAGEALGELVLAIRRGLRARDLAATTHAYPTYLYGTWDAAIAEVRNRLQRPASARLITTLGAARRRWIELTS
ncbi:MAG TPA: FAD-dependent oxidoreductase [Mycobacteriales bacterium]|nr:FAD-dependent oxidoreductase [Mycobacteriales bacterium]